MITFRSKRTSGTSLVVQWLRLPASTVGDAGSVPDVGSKILHVTYWQSKKKKKTPNKRLALFLWGALLWYKKQLTITHLKDNSMVFSTFPVVVPCCCLITKLCPTLL